jgi:hypothetical protein
MVITQDLCEKGQIESQGNFLSVQRIENFKRSKRWFFVKLVKNDCEIYTYNNDFPCDFFMTFLTNSVWSQNFCVKSK